MPDRQNGQAHGVRPLAIHPAFAHGFEVERPKPDGESGLLSRFAKAGGKAKAFFQNVPPAYARDERAEPSYQLRDQIAILRLHCSLWHDDYMVDGYYGYGGLSLQLRTALADPDVAAILLDIDSPGGMVDGLFTLTDEMLSLRGTKPIWSFVNESCFSAAYAIASATDRILLPRSGECGSIGVVMMHFDESSLLERIGLKVTPVFSGDHKVDGAWWAALPDDVKARLQEGVDEYRLMFAETVSIGRTLDLEAVMNTEALTYRGEMAVEMGLADEVMSAADAFQALKAQVETSDQTGSTGAAAKPVAKETDMSMKQKMKARVEAMRGKPKPAASETPADDDEDEETPSEEEEAAAEEEEDVDAASDEDDAEPNEDAEEDDDEKEEASAASRERQRISAILTSKEAKGREGMAQKLAFETKMSAKSARGLLAAAPKGGDSFATRMAREKPAATGSDAAGDGKQSRLAQKVARRVAALNKQKAR
ncbi:MAG: S49 family peptidase [Parvibaculaceae bacterium]|nr:S49 family peptidase [Parvibaculaceae bacterium]